MTDTTEAPEPARLSRQRTIFRRAHESTHTVFYGDGSKADIDVVVYGARLSDDYPDAFRTLEVTAADVAAMGSPETITVTVEPGDTLNGIAGARARVARAQMDVIEQVREARRNGTSWAEIGVEFDISRQAAWERFAALMDDD